MKKHIFAMMTTLMGVLIGIAITIPAYSLNNSCTDEALKFDEALHHLQAVYVDKSKVKDRDHLFQVAIEAILRDIGEKHGGYYPDEKESKRLVVDKGYVGVGVRIDYYKKDGHEGLLVVTTFEGAPSVGKLYPGDVIVGVDSIDFSTLKVEGLKGTDEDVFTKIKAFVPHVKGEPDSVAKLKVLRDGKIKTVRVNRAAIKQEPVHVKMLDKDGIKVMYVRLDIFSKGAVQQIVDKGKKMGPFHGLVLDLRGDGGGLVNEALKLMDIFEEKGTLMITIKDRLGSHPVHAWKDPVIPVATPMVILIDENSASASEMVTKSLMANKVATSMGVKSYGKGSEQSFFDLPDGSQIKFTIGKFFVSEDDPVDGVGITPTIVVEPVVPASDVFQKKVAYYIMRTSGDPAKDNQLDAAIGWIKKQVDEKIKSLQNSTP